MTAGANALSEAAQEGSSYGEEMGRILSEVQSSLHLALANCVPLASGLSSAIIGYEPNGQWDLAAEFSIQVGSQGESGSNRADGWSISAIHFFSLQS